ncbi:MAG: lipoprotein A-like protein [Streptomycetaceae bacterium]|nr:lipoprotein A-like protein [Streptomycetaceae bacterium]
MLGKTGHRAYGRFGRKKIAGILVAISVAVVGSGIWVSSSANGATVSATLQSGTHILSKSTDRRSHSRHEKTVQLASSLETPASTATEVRISGQLGAVHTGIATWYAQANGGGNCLYDPTSDIAIAAINVTDYNGSAMCGAYLHVKGPQGEITVKVVDNCPAPCHPGQLDLSEGAFTRIAGNPVLGQIPISWTLVSPAISGPVSYRYKEGSTRWWCAIQVRNHRNPVAKLEVLTPSGWLQLQRADYNYFVSPSGTGCGSQIRITDIYGQVLTDSGIALNPGVVQSGSGQFAQPN